METVSELLRWIMPIDGAGKDERFRRGNDNAQLQVSRNHPPKLVWVGIVGLRAVKWCHFLALSSASIAAKASPVISFFSGAYQPHSFASLSSASSFAGILILPPLCSPGS